MADLADVDPDAVVRLGVELRAYVGESAQVRSAADSAAASEGRRIRDEVARRAAISAAAEKAYRRCTADPDSDCSEEYRAMIRAAQRLEQAQRCLHRFELAHEHYRLARSRHRSSLDHTGDRVQIRLATIARDLSIYQRFSLSVQTGSGHVVAFGGSGGGSSRGGGASYGGIDTTGGGAIFGSVGGGGSGGAVLPHPKGAPEGAVLVPLSAIDDSDSRVTGPNDFKMDCSPEDLEWGFEALRNVVLPALALNLGADYFSEKDAREGLYGSRSYSDTYSGFFGTNEAPRFRMTPQGTLQVANGYHRVWVARRRGLDAIPGRIEP